MEIIQILKRTAKENPNLFIITGQIRTEGNIVIVTPKPDDNKIEFHLDSSDIVEGPFDFESNTSPYDRDDVKAIKVRKGSVLQLAKNGILKGVVLDSTREANMFRINSLNNDTYCVGLVEFECGTDKVLGACIFGWDCD
ncbi:MAG: hypothetical protein KBF51_05715 [Chitinophagales bacterium]|nr:hypothetical protein [Chitinophagales bacterium]